MDLQRPAGRQRHGPEQAISPDARVKVMSLITEIHKVRSQRPLVEIDSNEHKRSVVVFPVLADVLAIHEAHVSIEHTRRSGRWPARPWPLNRCDSYGAIEV